MTRVKTMVAAHAARELDISIPATSAAIPEVTLDVMRLLADRHWPEDQRGSIELALHEALTNGVRHGCKNDPKKRVRCLVTCDESGELMIVIRDEGAGFDVASLPNPIEGANVLKTSGRGVFLITKLMDDVRFADGGRELRMRKWRDRLPR
jgi:serine/threonine-protein kinase RsbW